jgi:hypothetical protein
LRRRGLHARFAAVSRWQARFERSAIGRALLSLIVIFVLFAIVVVNMPDSQLRRDAGRVTQPFVDATGLDQDWGIFSQPRTLAAYVDGRIEYADGSTSVIGIGTSNGLGAYADYRWQKYEEIIRPNSGEQYWHDYAVYLARKAGTSARKVVRVTLSRRYALTLPPGPGPAHGPWQQYTMYVLNVGGAQ